MSFKKMDPSCTVGFYCETKAEFEKFRQQTTEVSSVNKHYYPKQDTAFFLKNILQNHQFVESLAELFEPIWTPSPVVTFAVIRATTFSQFMEQFCSLIKTRLRITANDISWWVPKALLNFQQNNCWCWRIFVITCHPNRRISTLSLPFLPFPSSFKFPSSPSRRTDQPVYWQVTLGWSSCCDTNKLCSLFHGPWQWLCPSWPQNKIVLEIGWIENWNKKLQELDLELLRQDP